MPRPEDVLRVLRAAADPGGVDSVAITLLSGGSARRSYLASANERAWVVRTPADGAPGALGLEEECAVTRIAGELGITPKVTACDAAAGLLITEYRPNAAVLTPEDCRRPETLLRVAPLLKALHRVRRDVRPFEPRGFASGYVERLGGLSRMRAVDRRLAVALGSAAEDYVALYPAAALCHNDLVASNLLEDGGRVWLIDFEYAVNAAPVLDLASLAAMNDFDADSRRELIDAYYSGRPVPITLADLDAVVRLVRLLGYFWALLRARGTEDPEPHARLAAHLRAQLE